LVEKINSNKGDHQAQQKRKQNEEPGNTLGEKGLLPHTIEYSRFEKLLSGLFSSFMLFNSINMSD
jgi:hypothetical protein